MSKIWYVEPSEFHSIHLAGVKQSLDEFESLTKANEDLNVRYDLLQLELKNLHSDYLISNQNKLKNKLTFKEQLSILIQPNEFLKEKLSDNLSDRLNFMRTNFANHTLKNPLELIQSTIFLILMFIFLFFNYLMVFYEFMGNLNINYVSILNYLILLFKFSFYQATELALEFFSYVRLNLKSIK